MQSLFFITYGDTQQGLTTDTLEEAHIFVETLKNLSLQEPTPVKYHITITELKLCSDGCYRRDDNYYFEELVVSN